MVKANASAPPELCYSVVADVHLRPSMLSVCVSKTAEVEAVVLRAARFPGSLQNLFAMSVLSNWELHLLRSHKSAFETFSFLLYRKEAGKHCGDGAESQFPVCQSWYEPGIALQGKK